MDAARWAGSVAGVDEHHVIEARPGLHERDCFTGAFPHLEGATVSAAEPPRDDSASAVIAPFGVADADDEAAPARYSFRRSSFRKCVAHEMQGS